MDNLIHYASLFLFAAGSFFIITGALGLLRFPDFYTRMHASGITDTLGADLILWGMILQADGDWLLIAKLLIIMLFMMFTSPVSTHSIAHAAWVGGLNPLLGKELKHTDIAPDRDESQAVLKEQGPETQSKGGAV
jgi:multicomponent Na+:H+ antiporter subunit G